MKLNLTYQFDDDRLVYATYSEGFRVGGSNPLKAASVLPRDYASDELKNYEVGLKSEWLDNRLRFNIAAYYMEWEDFAVQIEDPQRDSSSSASSTCRAAEIPGVEAEFAFSLSDNWQLDGAMSWNDAQTDGIDVLCLRRGRRRQPLGIPVQDGARLPLTPDWSATLGIEYRSSGQLLDAQPFARFDFAYVGESVNSLEGIESVVSGNPAEIQDAYETGDLRFGLEATPGALRSSSTTSGTSARSCSSATAGPCSGCRSTRRGPTGCSSGSTSDRALTILVATSVVRGSRQGESHGGVYLVDFGSDRAARVLDWNTMGIDWQGRGWDRGLRGIEFDGETVYIAASDELFAYTPDFRLIGSWRNRYLKHCHEICRHERTLFLTSTGFDSILGFDLDAKSFSWGLQVAAVGDGFAGRPFDPEFETGPAPGNSLHLNNVFCAPGGMHISGMRTGGMLLFNGREISAGSRSRSARTTRGRSATACCSTTRRRTSCGSHPRSAADARFPGAALSARAAHARRPGRHPARAPGIRARAVRDRRRSHRSRLLALDDHAA